MQFTPIDLASWPRREHFQYYRGMLPCGYSVTVRLDVTRFSAMLRQQKLSFFPAFVWCVSHNIIAHPAFRMGVDKDGNPGYFDRMHPNYTVFHPETHTFSDLWSEHSEDFSTFWAAMRADRAAFGDNLSFRPKPNQPPNFYCISWVPWLDFSSYAASVSGSGLPNLFPVITFGKITEENGTLSLPFVVNIAHAAADGWHTAEFFRTLQLLLDTVTLPAQEDAAHD